MGRLGKACLASLAVHASVLVPFRGWQGTPPATVVAAGTSNVEVHYLPPARPMMGLADGVANSTAPDAPPAAAAVLDAGAEHPQRRPGGNPAPAYPFEAYRRGIQGVTMLLVEVDARGRAAAVAMERSSGSLILDEAAAQAVSRWTFTPARRGNVPVAGRLRIRVRFQIVEDRAP